MPSHSDVLYDIGESRDIMRKWTVAFSSTQHPTPLFVDLDGATFGLAGTIRCKHGSNIFYGLCALEDQEDGKDYLNLGMDSAFGQAEVVLVKQELFCAFLCRAWARQNLFEAVRPNLHSGRVCPFDASGQLVLDSDEAAAYHYLELLLGRGQKSKCPQAEKYLQGVARDMMINQLPYLCAVLEDRGTVKPEDSVLSILTALDGGAVEIPRDYQEDLALAVAAKALELVQVMGLDL